MEYYDRKDKWCNTKNPCTNQLPFFKMYRSTRPRHMDWMEGMWPWHDGPDWQCLLCPECELKERKLDWSYMSDWEKKQAGKEYATIETVLKAIKKTSRGNAWGQQADHMKKARLCLKGAKETATVRLSQMIVEHRSVIEVDNNTLELFKTNAVAVPRWQRDKIEEGLLKVATSSAERVTARQMMKDVSMSRSLMTKLVFPMVKNAIKGLVAAIMENATETMYPQCSVQQALVDTQGRK